MHKSLLVWSDGQTKCFSGDTSCQSEAEEPLEPAHTQARIIGFNRQYLRELGNPSHPHRDNFCLSPGFWAVFTVSSECSSDLYDCSHAYVAFRVDHNLCYFFGRTMLVVLWIFFFAKFLTQNHSLQEEEPVVRKITWHTTLPSELLISSSNQVYACAFGKLCAHPRDHYLW